MPRKSPEAMTATLYRSQGKAPAPPAHLDRKAKALWREITHAYPVDYFLPGAEQLLEAFVEAVVMRRFYVDLWKRHPGDQEYAKSVATLTNTLNQTAQKLRLSNSARLHRHSGILQEQETKPLDDGNDTTLYGTNVVKF
jgi:hypothetical protein